MATILNAYDLSAGSTETSVISDAVNVNIGWKLSGETDPEKTVVLTLKVQVGGEDFHPLQIAHDEIALAVIKGNGSGNINFMGINAGSLKLDVAVQTDMDGILSIYSYES